MIESRHQDIGRSVAVLAALAAAVSIVAANPTDVAAAPWKRVALPQDSQIFWLQTDRRDQRLIRALIDDRNLATPAAIWESRNGGRSFTKAATASPNTCAALPRTEPECFTTKSGRRVLRWSTDPGTLQLSRNSGQSFTTIRGLPRGYFATAAFGSGSHLVTALKVNSPIPTMLSSVYTSSDSGKRWKRLKRTPRDVQAAAISGKRLLLGGAAGLVTAPLPR